MTDIDRILGRVPSLRESSSLIPTDATEIPGTEGATNPEQQHQHSAAPEQGQGGFLSTGLALVAPDTTPKSSYPLNPAQVPAQPVAQQPVSGAAHPEGPASTQSYFPRPAPVATDTALSDPALAAIVGESIRSISEGAVSAGARVSAALSQGAEMPAPVVADQTKVCDAFRRFNR